MQPLTAEKDSHEFGAYLGEMRCETWSFLVTGQASVVNDTQDSAKHWRRSHGAIERCGQSRELLPDVGIQLNHEIENLNATLGNC